MKNVSFEEKSFQHYKLTKRFGFPSYKTYDEDDVDEVERFVKLYSDAFDYIFKRLDYPENTFLKDKFYSQLIKIKDYQNLSYFEDTFENLAYKIKKTKPLKLHQTKSFKDLFESDKLYNDIIVTYRTSCK